MLVLTLVIDETKTEGKNWTAVGNMPVKLAQQVLTDLLVEEGVRRQLNVIEEAKEKTSLPEAGNAIGEEK